MKYLKIFKSVLSAMIGVQKKKNLEEDFSNNSSATPFIIVGMIMTIVFIVAVWLVVQLVLGNAN